jgi:ankyrin repeat protein
MQNERFHFRAGLLAAVAGALFCFVAPAAFAQQLYEDFLFAVNNDRAGDVRALLQRGIDPNTVDPNGDPVLVIAARAGYLATVDVLLAGRADVNARNRYGDTALMSATLNGHLDVVKTLRARGTEVNQVGWTALIYAAAGGHDDIVRYLLAEGADINAASPNGTTALMMAVREGRFATAELLVARGADVNHRNQNGASALEWAKRNNDTALVARLHRAGARD